jgi:glycosyltransferase involved in cell wall biosynthesis
MPERRTTPGRAAAEACILRPMPHPEQDAVQHGARDQAAEEIELSVVIPCLNEADTLAGCIEKAQEACFSVGVRGEVVVADNGSSDGSREIALRHHARVVEVAERGYGAALAAGIAAARGKYVVMGDADASYDFGETPKFLARLREGYDLVQGCRLPSGGGTIEAGAMPFLHRYWGNPMFSALSRVWFKAPIHDVYCGLRGFRRDWQGTLHQRCTGMEFATEMIIKASLFGARMSEVPIVLHPDGRKAHAPHLRTFQDGWRTLRFFLMYSPRWMFLLPGLFLILLGVVGYGVALPGLRAVGVTFDAHTLLFASLFMICGYQAVLFAVMTKTFAIAEGLLPMDARMQRVFRIATLERGLIVGAAAMLFGAVLLLLAVGQWWRAHFGALDYAHTMRYVIPGVTITALGFQTILSSFFISILGLVRR